MESVIRSDLHYDNHSNTLTHITTQPTEKIILERNAQLRNNPGALHDLGAQSGESFGRMVASIPFIMYEKALRDGYDLNSPDSKFAGREMNRFLQSADGRLCLVQGKS
jgi:hypothetical protein